MILTEDHQHLVVIKPMRNPPSIASFVERLPDHATGYVKGQDIVGRWNWEHDGSRKSGDLILWPGGRLGHLCGWSGGEWSIMPDGEVKLKFNGITHYMILSKNKK